MKHFVILASLVILFCFNAPAQTTIPAKLASNHIGKTVKIYDRVFSGRLTPSNTTLLYLGGNYPNQALTVIINNSDKNKFKGHPEVDDRGKDFIVTGKVINYEGKPGIVIKGPEQFKVVLIDNNLKLKRF